MSSNILLVEDHLIVKDGIKLVLDSEDELHVVGDLSRGDEVLPFLAKNQVDLVLLDINLPGVDGLTLASEIKTKYAGVKILVLTFYNKAAFIKGIAESGAEGYILKNSSKEEVITAIFKVLNGENHFSKEATETLLKSMRRQGTNYEVKLTKREIEVMILMANAYTVNEVADKLFISAHTAETHRKNIMAKLKFKNKAEMTLYAKENGYLDLPGSID